MPDVDLQAVAADLAKASADLEKTTANLKHHIADEANKRAALLGKTYAKAADERIRDNEVDLQRAQDLVRELRRQMKPLIQDAYAYHALKKRVLELAKLAEDGGDVGPARMLRAAIGEANTSARAKWEQEQAEAKQRIALDG